MTKAERDFIQYHGYRGVKSVQGNGILIFFGVVHCPLCAAECAFSNFNDAFDFIKEFENWCPLVDDVDIHDNIREAYIEASYGKDGARLFSDITTHKLFITCDSLAHLLTAQIFDRA